MTTLATECTAPAKDLYNHVIDHYVGDQDLFTTMDPDAPQWMRDLFNDCVHDRWSSRIFFYLIGSLALRRTIDILDLCDKNDTALNVWGTANQERVDRAKNRNGRLRDRIEAAQYATIAHMQAAIQTELTIHGN